MLEEKDIIKKLQKEASELNPSRKEFDALVKKIQATRRVTKTKPSRFIDREDGPSAIINNLTKTIMNRWKIAFPAVAVVLVAIFLSYNQGEKDRSRFATEKTPLTEQSQEPEVPNNLPPGEEVNAVFASLETEESVEDSLLQEESVEIAFLAEETQDFNELSESYENEL